MGEHRRLRIILNKLIRKRALNACAFFFSHNHSLNLPSHSRIFLFFKSYNKTVFKGLNSNLFGRDMKDMQAVHNIDFKKLAISCGISLGVGAVSGLVSMSAMNEFQKAVKPPLTPPGWLFPIVWTILYILMGVSSYIVYESKTQEREVRNAALTVYAAQLVVNFFYPIIFFNLSAYLLAFIWILILLALVAVMVLLFFRISTLAGALQIPYLVWVTFATYLTFGIFILN